MTTATEPVVHTELTDGLLRIALNRPEALNSFNRELSAAFQDAVAGGARDPAVRAMLITGTGRGFSAGADLKGGSGDSLTDRDLGATLREIYNPVMLEIARAPKPVIAAVNGPAAGYGAAVAFACDLIVARESAYFMLAFVNVGLVPDGGSSYTLTQRVGVSRAMQLAMLGERLSARTALEWGVVNAVFADDEFEAGAQAYAAKLATGPTIALAGMKRAIRAVAGNDFSAQLDLEAEQQAIQGRTADFAEGVAAFSEKRKPRFSGR